MTGWNGVQVCLSAFAGAYIVLGLFVVFGRIGDWGLRQIERRQRSKRTTLVNRCPDCKRVEQYGWVPFDPDHGLEYQNRACLCTACEFRHATHGNPLVFDTETWTVDAIRRIDPDYTVASGQVSRDAAGSSRNA